MRVAVAYFNEIKAEDLAWALLQAGIDAEIIDLPISIYSTDQKDARAYADFIGENSIDAVLTYDFSAALSDGCKLKSIPYVSWIYDCPQKALYEDAVANDCNFIYSFDKRQVEIIKKYGGKHVFYQPLGTNVYRNSGTQITKEDEAKYSCNVSFIGNLFSAGIYDLCEKVATDSTKSEYRKILTDAYGIWDGVDRIHNRLSPEAIDNLLDIGRDEFGADYKMDLDEFFAARLISYELTGKERREMLSRLVKYDVKFFTGEKDVDIPGITPFPAINYIDGLPKAYNLSKININLTLHSITQGIPLRVFDIMGAGGFVLSNYQPAIEEEFEIGKEIVIYHDLDEMEDKVKYYLVHENERKKIALNGNKAVKARFDNEHIIKRMIEDSYKTFWETPMESTKELLRKQIEEGNIENAYATIEDNFEKEAEIIKKDAEYCVLVATAYMSKGEFEKAFDIIRAGIACDNTNYELFLMLGEYYALTNLNQALLCFYQALYFCDSESDRQTIIGFINDVVGQGASICPVAFVIATHNNLDHLKKCIDSIINTVAVELREIIVVDDASTDGTGQWLSENKDIIWKSSDRQVGNAAIINEGIKLCSPGKDIVVLSSDNVLLDNSLLCLGLGLYSDDSVGVVGALTDRYLEREDGSSDPEIAEMLNRPMMDSLDEISRLLDYGMLIRREVIDEIGEFDEGNIYGFYEDSKFFEKARNKGWNVYLSLNGYMKIL